MFVIFGFAGVAASLEFHLRPILCGASDTVAGRRYDDEDVALQMQRLRARDAGADMMCGCVEAVIASRGGCDELREILRRTGCSAAMDAV